MRICKYGTLDVVRASDELMLIRSSKKWFAWDTTQEWTANPLCAIAKSAIARAMPHLVRGKLQTVPMLEFESEVSAEVLRLFRYEFPGGKPELRHKGSPSKFKLIEEWLNRLQLHHFREEQDRKWISRFAKERLALHKTFRWLCDNATHRPPRIVWRGPGKRGREVNLLESWPDKYAHGACASDLVRHGLYDDVHRAQVALSLINLVWGGKGSSSDMEFDWPLTAILPESPDEPIRYLIEPVPLSPVQRLMLETIELKVSV